jgi:two-component system cell cycle sensor histidine kinase/response regulator CckA
MSEPDTVPPKGTILVVDDTPANLRVLMSLLTSKGYTVRPAPSGERALQFVQATLPDLILLDILMPGMDGYAVCAQLKADARTSAIPVIFLSSEHEPLNKVQAFALGGVDYITKPFQAEEVLARVETHLSLGMLRKHLEALVQERTHELSAANDRLKAEIAERKRLEAQLLQAQKMESVGQLAGGIAHDFNNLLTAITGYTELLRNALSPDAPAQHDLDEIARAAERAANLTRQLLAFARKQIIEPQVLNLNDLLLETNKLVRRLIGEDIELAVVPAPNLGLVKVDPGQLEQVLVNMAVNARHAMPYGGKLTIETRNVVLDQDEAGQYVGLTPGAYVSLAVSDTGIGMDQATQAHIFEPFFTTKGPGEGTGLGLAMCYGIVKQHGGDIAIDSGLGRGTTFKIYLPRVAHAATVPAQLDAPPMLRRGSEAVLVVEDDSAVRALAVQVLRQQGYRVLEAGHGQEALRIVREPRAEGLALLVTDMVMPQMSGKILAEQIVALCPGIKVLFMSGYTGTAIDLRDQTSLGSNFLQKPFAPSSLVRKVREVLDV